MELFLTCFFNEDDILESVCCPQSSLKHELSVHLHASIGMKSEVIFAVPEKNPEGYFLWGQRIYWYAVDNKNLCRKKIVLISDANVKLHYFKQALDTVPIGVQIFDGRGVLLYLNKACEEMEHLKLENVEGKHVMDIYDVDREYSTIMNTLKKKEKVEDRCGIFQNRDGHKLYSLNTGSPVFLEDRFIGAVGNVYDMEVLDKISEKRGKIQCYLKENHRALKINSHEEKKYSTFDDVIGESEELKRAVSLAEKVAVNDSPILLYGETGVGKEIFAQSIHSASMRREREFVAVNCAALPSGLIESLLFGTVKGAFTGSADKKGILESAEGGTLFLDEINSMDLGLQSKLLRVIQEKKFRRVGDTRMIACDIRFVSAMNEEPSAAIDSKHLREDLYYRLATIAVEIPPLRARKEDILPLAEYGLRQISRRYFKEISTMSHQVKNILQEYRWPGNVRELFQVLEYACNFAEGAEIQMDNLPVRMIQSTKFTLTQRKEDAVHENKIQDFALSDTNVMQGTIQERLLRFEKEIIEEELRKNNYNISKASEKLGIKRQNLQYRMKKCGIKLNISLD